MRSARTQQARRPREGRCDQDKRRCCHTWREGRRTRDWHLQLTTASRRTGRAVLYHRLFRADSAGLSGVVGLTMVGVLGPSLALTRTCGKTDAGAEWDSALSSEFPTNLLLRPIPGQPRLGIHNCHFPVPNPDGFPNSFPAQRTFSIRYKDTDYPCFSHGLRPHPRHDTGSMLLGVL